MHMSDEAAAGIHCKSIPHKCTVLRDEQSLVAIIMISADTAKAKSELAGRVFEWKSGEPTESWYHYLPS